MDADCRVYVEEAGSGIPLVCLHTAGGRRAPVPAPDVRRSRHLALSGARLRHAWHGKSYPPVGWQDCEYQLTTERYVQTVRAFCKAMALDRPVVMGCSIGGESSCNSPMPTGRSFAH